MKESSVLAAAHGSGIGAVRPGGEANTVVIYITRHCPTCAYSAEVVAFIRHKFPHVTVRVVDLEDPGEEIPEVVFATPTYLLNGRLWSLGNPSNNFILESLHKCLGMTDKES